MLIPVIYIKEDIADTIARANGNSTKTIKHETGIYEVGHFSFNMCIPRYKYKKKDFPDLPSGECFGVCDHYRQVLTKYPELKTSSRKFVLSITPVLKVNQPPRGGWRWHKWGEYIGDKTPTKEYLYDEPKIEKVYCYHILEIL